MTDIVEFLSAQFDAEAKRWQTIWRFQQGDKRIDGWWDLGGTLGYAVSDIIDTTRGGREVAAKRRVLARHHPAVDGEMAWHVGACVGCGTYGEFADPRTPDINDCPELRDLAAPYADRLGFKPEWMVE